MFCAFEILIKILICTFAVLRRNYGRCLDFFYKSTRVTSGGKSSILKKPGLVTSTTDGPIFNIFKMWTCAKKLSKHGTTRKS